MTPSAERTQYLADLLRDHDEATWQHVETEVLPKVLKALERRFGPGRHWQDLNDVAQSAQRTALRRLSERTDPRLEELETLAQFEKWLVVVARNKLVDALRRADTERTHAPDVGRLLQTRLAELGQEAADEVVRRLEALLPAEDRPIFRGKLAQESQVAIAAQLGCSTRTVTNRWKQIKARLLREAAD